MPLDRHSNNDTRVTKKIALPPDGETVLVSTRRIPTGRERIVRAFREGANLYIPLDTGRNANRELFDARTLFIRRADSEAHCDRYKVRDRWPISQADRARLNRQTQLPISDTTEVLHLTRAAFAIGALQDEPPGFAVVVDGSERAVSAIAPAIALADWYGRPCTVVVATAGSDDHDSPNAVRCQIEDTRLSVNDLITVAKSDLDEFLFSLMNQGHIVVASAFGTWAADGRVHGMLSGLVRHDAPAVVGIGPNVVSDWKPDVDKPILICVDDSVHAHHIVARLEPFVRPARARVLVVHVTTDGLSECGVAQRIADEIHQRYGMPVEAQTITDESAAAAIAILASRTQSQLVVTHSWHRPRAGSPTVCSTSLAAVAHVPCPVVVLGD